MTWVLAAPRAALGPLRPLLRAHERSREVRVVDPGPLETLREAVDGAAGLLLVGDRRRSPRTALPGLFIEDPAGRLVPAGWLPDLGTSSGSSPGRPPVSSAVPGPLARSHC